MKLFSILIADRPAVDVAALPPAVARNVASFREHHPALPHQLYDQDAIRDFLRGHMEADVAWAFEELMPYAYRADLARLCLLHEFGGAYADLSVFFHAPLPVSSGKLAIFRDRAVHAPWIVSNTIIAAPPRLPAFEAAIRMIVANCRTRYRGASSLCPTGPILFGKAIAMHCEPEQIHLGEVINLAQRDNTEALAFVDATDGRMIGYRTKSAAGLQQLGLSEGVNNYNDFYYAHLVYASDYPVRMLASYLARHGRTDGVMEGDQLVLRSASTDEHPAPVAGSGTAACHIPLPFAAGRYCLLLVLAEGGGGELTLRANIQGSGATLAEVRARVDGAAPAAAALTLDLPGSRKDIVVCILAGGGAHLRIAELRIERLAHDLAP
ncbi:capsular polysaccharide synthesis protein [Massilia sp. YIM B02769]|uniref:glycosyltransferase family 32 protein n=1 Tax=Massilia sp. YIM B02769 TaxID=3050129 RepID=UPI0025B727C6|nr:glycosyltransferase [Massilia sp. YIM B02769]MDN4061636.1 capsular polysaccharide synthesis protein [Massilia sp. YIM B02769]